MVGHVSSYPYATLDQALADLPTARDFAAGLVGTQTVETGCGVKALHTCGSFALGLALPHRQPVGAAEVPYELATGLVGLANAAQPAGVAFQADPTGGASWLSVALAIFELLKKLRDR